MNKILKSKKAMQISRKSVSAAVLVIVVISLTAYQILIPALAKTANLEAEINPTNIKLGVNQHQTFNATVSGGREPYQYFWGIIEIVNGDEGCFTLSTNNETVDFVFVKPCDFVKLSLTVVDARGQSIQTDTIIYEPFTATSTAAFVIRTDGRYTWAINDDGQIVYNATDSRTVIQNVIDATEGPIYIAEGTYTPSGNLQPDSNTVIVGAGWNTIIRPSAGSSVFIFEGTSNSHYQNVTIKNLQIDGTNLSSGKGIYCTYVDNLDIENLYVHDTPHSGIGPDFIDDFSITNCLVEDVALTVDGNGIGIGGPSQNGFIGWNVVKRVNRVTHYGNAFVIEQLQNDTYSHDITVMGNVGEDCDGSGFFGVGVQFCNIVNNHFNNNNNGVFFPVWNTNYEPSAYVNIEGNTCNNNTDSGVRLDITNQEMTYTIIKGNQLNFNNKGVVTKCDKTLIDANIITGNTDGVFLYQCASSTVTNNMIIGNTDGLELSTTTFCMINDNYFDNTSNEVNSSGDIGSTFADNFGYMGYRRSF